MRYVLGILGIAAFILAGYMIGQAREQLSALMIALFGIVALGSAAVCDVVVRASDRNEKLAYEAIALLRLERQERKAAER